MGVIETSAVANAIIGMNAKEADVMGVSCRYFSDRLAEAIAEKLDPEDRESFLKVCGDS